jgi:predicted DNA-binding protein (UPF0251 family)
VGSRYLENLALTLDEFEAIRLADFAGKNHIESAGEMGISRSTFSRLVERARNKVAQFLIEGRHLQIDGGAVHFQNNVIRCEDCGHLSNLTFDSETTRCPDCGSPNLADLAHGFGHGRCCHRHHGDGRI